MGGTGGGRRLACLRGGCAFGGGGEIKGLKISWSMGLCSERVKKFA